MHFLSPNFPPKSKSPKVDFRVCLLSSSSRPLQLTGIPKKIATFVSLILARWSRAIEEKISKLQPLGSCNIEELMRIWDLVEVDGIQATARLRCFDFRGNL
ncbi:hypothetical protein Droror1_Dr00017561, partial [Drosera rotundifolia]